MSKAISRTYVDLTSGEIISSLLQLLNVNKARGSDKVPEFEKAFAEYIGVKQAVAFSQCRAGMYFALKALNLKGGDEIILPVFTFWVDVAMVVLAGLKPVFVDVDFDTMNIDPRKIRGAITSRTKAIFPTHLNGIPADMEPIVEIAEKHKLRIIEDCARSCGAEYNNKRVGSFDIGAFSFGYGKSFYDFGGAMITSNDENFILRLRKLKKNFKRISIKDLYIQTLRSILLRYLNSPSLYRFSIYPFVYKFQAEGKERWASMFRVRMLPYASVPEKFMINFNNLQADIGLSQLKRIDESNRKRMRNARILNEELANLLGLHIPPSTQPNLAVHYSVWTARKQELQSFLTREGIDVQDETAIDNSQLNRFKPYAKGLFPNARKLHNKVIFLPTHPYLEKKDMLFIAQKVKEFFESNIPATKLASIRNGGFL